MDDIERFQEIVKEIALAHAKKMDDLAWEVFKEYENQSNSKNG